jgi:hypothetical protein
VSSVSTSLQIGPEETRAVININTKMNPKMKDIFMRATKRHGLTNGPFTHGCLGSDLVCMGAKLSSLAPYFANNMVLDEASSVTLAERIVQDWEELPKQMRKTCTDQGVTFFFKICAGFHFMLRLFQAEVATQKHAI